jgi:octaprenyl-diphosphate synthase
VGGAYDELIPSIILLVIDFVKDSGGIEYAEGVMEKYFNEALEILQTFEDSAYKESLNNLVQYTILRNK